MNYRNEAIVKDLALPLPKAATAEELFAMVLSKNPNFTLVAKTSKKKGDKGKGKKK